CIVHQVAAPAPQPPVSAPPSPPVSPQPQPPVSAPSPAPAPVASPLGGASVVSLTGGRVPATQITQRLELPQVGRYTLVLRDRVTGRRLRWLRGSRIGSRTLTRAASAPVHSTAAPGRRLLIRARVAAPARWMRSGRV